MDSGRKRKRKKEAEEGKDSGRKRKRKKEAEEGKDSGRKRKRKQEAEGKWQDVSQESNQEEQ